MKHNPSQLHAFFALTWYAFKASIRNKSTLFFSLIFPLVFISAFGLINNSGTTIKIGFPDGSVQTSPVVATLKKIPTIKPQTGYLSYLEDQLNKGKVDAVVDAEGNGLQINLYTSNANPTTSAAAQSIVRGVVDQVNLKLLNVTKPPVVITNKEISGRQSRYIDFLLPGQIGFSLLNIALFGTVFGFLALRRLMVLKRMFATPVRPITILLSQGASRLILALIQSTIILAVGVIGFHFYLPHGWLTFIQLLFLSTLGLIAFLGFGLFLSGFANDENSAGPLVNLVSMPQLLLSGVFFGSDLLPSWIQPVANNLPLSYFNQAVRKITTEGGNFTDTFPYIAGFMIWGLVMYLLASRTFKWE